MIEGVLTAQDHTKLFFRSFDAGPSTPVLWVIHGHGEHSGRYEKFLPWVTSMGYSFVVWDLRGNGRSGGDSAFVNSFRDYLSDAHCCYEFLSNRSFRGRPIVLMGHSLGALIALWYVNQFHPPVKGLIFSSPCFGLNLPSILVDVNRVLSKIIPKFCYQDPVYPPHLSHDPQEVEKYKKDRWIQRKMSVRLLDEMVTYSRLLKTVPAFKMNFPVHFLLADLEKVVDRRCAQAVYEKIEAPDKSLEMFSGFYHEIFNELEQEKAFRALQDRLKRLKVD